MKNYLFFAWCFVVAATLYFAKLLPNSCHTSTKISHIELDSLNHGYFSLTLENVYREIMQEEIKFSDIVLRQCVLETGWLTSKNCLDRNNLFGMRGGVENASNPSGYKIYKNWVYSIRAYKRWQRRAYGDSTEDYYKFLDSIGYATSTEYIHKLKSINLVVLKK